MVRHVRQAAAEGASIVHFPECSLPGYSCFDEIDWQKVERDREQLAAAAAESGIWAIYGSYRRLPDGGKLRNSLHVVSSAGKTVATYDKLHLRGRQEVLYCQPGNEICCFEINGFKCGLLICFDMCFPKLFERYRDEGVVLLFLSCYNAGVPAGSQSLDELMPATVRTRAADHGMWISATNSSVRPSRLAACMARPDGSLKSLRKHRPGILYHDFPDTDLGWTYDNRVGHRPADNG